MDKTSRKLLQYFCKIGNEKYLATFILRGDERQIAKKLNISVARLNRCIDYLCQNGYLQYAVAHNTVTGIFVTHQGYQYKEFAFKNFMKSMYTSYAIPIIVAIITLLITTLVTKMLS